MAEQEKVGREKGAKPAIPQNQGPAAKILPWLIMVAAVIGLATAGFVVGRLFGTRGQAQTASGGESPSADADLEDLNTKDGKNEGWFYDLDPVVANLNEPGVTRYVRVSLTLEITTAWNQEEAKLFLDQKKPLVKHWLTLYLANQTIEDTRGERNLVRMQSHICEALNQGLFPDAKPRIKDILLREFAIQ